VGSALAQEGEPATAAPTEATTRGALFFEDVPPQVDNFGDTSYLWRIQLAPHGPQLPLDQMLVTVQRQGEKPRPAQIQLRGYRAWPRVLALPQGSTLTVRNGDPLSYSLAFEGRPLEPLELPSAGSSASVTLDKPGRYALLDPAFASTTCYVVVAPVVASSALRQGKDGEALFDLGALAAGSYQIEFYFQGERMPSMSRQVQVSADGTLTPARFLITRKDFQATLNP
jgi:hypothetical protein